MEFKPIEEARKKRGQSAEEACVEIGISYPTWRRWKYNKGRPFNVHAAQRQAVERYIARAKEAK